MEPLDRLPSQVPLHWAHNQLALAYDIVDNPGGGMLFATQTIGQVRASLTEQDAERWEATLAVLYRAEQAALQRRYFDCRREIAIAFQLLEANPISAGSP